MAAQLTISTRKTCYIGGLVGYNSGILNGCISNVAINATSTNFKCFAGGLIGYNSGSYNSCQFIGTISAKGYSDSYTYIGDYVGYAQ